VLARGALEAGQVGGHGQPQPVSEQLGRIGWRWGQLCEGCHALTLQRPAVTMTLSNTRLGQHDRARRAAHYHGYFVTV
jgi:hypothetical protein